MRESGACAVDCAQLAARGAEPVRAPAFAPHRTQAPF